MKRVDESCQTVARFLFFLWYIYQYFLRRDGPWINDKVWWIRQPPLSAPLSTRKYSLAWHKNIHEFQSSVPHVIFASRSISNYDINFKRCNFIERNDKIEMTNFTVLFFIFPCIIFYLDLDKFYRGLLKVDQ